MNEGHAAQLELKEPKLEGGQNGLFVDGSRILVGRKKKETTQNRSVNLADHVAAVVLTSAA